MAKTWDCEDGFRVGRGVIRLDEEEYPVIVRIIDEYRHSRWRETLASGVIVVTEEFQSGYAPIDIHALRLEDPLLIWGLDVHIRIIAQRDVEILGRGEAVHARADLNWHN